MPALLSGEIIQPHTEAHWQHYYHLRFLELREPWQQPPGSERDSDEESGIHALYLFQEKAIGVGRIHPLADSTAQIRFMAVDSRYTGNGIGRKIVDFLEKEAVDKWKVSRVILQSRENAVPFYLKCGYKEVEKSFLLWGKIQHFLMEKSFT